MSTDERSNDPERQYRRDDDADAVRPVAGTASASPVAGGVRVGTDGCTAELGVGVGSVPSAVVFGYAITAAAPTRPDLSGRSA
ncbi:hypothetical protein ACFQL0_05295 [Haloplanus litoreus]|uniref:hypothetical protein n=1 Tax=Haloplanus litoreus TaxID=767515 RepID=UPI00361D483F